MKINKLIPLEKNPFKGSGDDQIKKIAASIETFGKMMEIRKIVIDEAFTILGGNKRYFACKELGMKDIPDSWIDQRTDLTEAEKKEFIVKDNAHYGSEWDYEMLMDWGAPIMEWGVAAEWPPNIGMDIMESGKESVGKSRNSLRWMSNEAPMTDDEIEKFTNLFEKYSEENKMPHGFVYFILEKLESYVDGN